MSSILAKILIFSFIVAHLLLLFSLVTSPKDFSENQCTTKNVSIAHYIHGYHASKGTCKKN